MSTHNNSSPLSPLPSPLASDIIAELSWRGLINQTTDDENLSKFLSEKPRTVYVGFDPTADSLHVGHLVALMVLRRFQKAGHRPIALVGGATGMIGDPSGKSEERNLLSVESLRANVIGMSPQLQRFLNFDCGTTSAVLVNNYDWMSKFGYLEFLRDVGKHFPVNVMLAKDSVRSRLERDDAGMSYTEFSYMLLQAYDFVHLHDEYGCEVQAGGSDQWGNITAGIDLARRLRGVQLYGCTCPLLTKSDGTKMGKTESGAVWLSPEKTSPYHFYQYWINLEDAEVGRCLRFFTDMDREEIESILAEHEQDPGRRTAQRRLASALTQTGPRRRRPAICPAGDRRFLRRRNHRPRRRPTGRHLRRRAEPAVALGPSLGRGPSGPRRLGRVGLGEEQERSPTHRHPGRRLCEQPPRRRHRNPPRPQCPRRKIHDDSPLGQEEIRPVAIRVAQATETDSRCAAECDYCCWCLWFSD